MATEEGQITVESLNNTSHVITIAPSQKPGNRVTAIDDPKGAQDGTGSGSEVRFDAANTTGGQADDGSTQRDPAVGLAHELGHALDIAAGSQSFDKGTGAPGTTPPSEQGTSLVLENAVRATLPNHAPRSYYNPPAPPRPRKGK